MIKIPIVKKPTKKKRKTETINDVSLDEITVPANNHHSKVSVTKKMSEQIEKQTNRTTSFNIKDVSDHDDFANERRKSSSSIPPKNTSSSPKRSLLNRDVSDNDFTDESKKSFHSKYNKSDSSCAQKKQMKRTNDVSSNHDDKNDVFNLNHSIPDSPPPHPVIRTKLVPKGSRMLLSRTRRPAIGPNSLFHIPSPIQERFAPSPSKYDFEPLSSSQPRSEEKSHVCPADPSCTAIVPKPYSHTLQQAIEYLRVCETNARNGSRGRDKVLFARSKVCRIHAAEQTIIPQGLAAGYRNNIDFLSEVPRRVKQLKKILVQIIKGKIFSSFRHEILKKIKNNGYWSSQSTATKLSQMENFKCGYYGWQGANAILGVLQDMFKQSESALTKNRIAPQNAFDYLQTVLVPETVIRLIAQDQGLDIESQEDLEKARHIMKESSDFGEAVYGDFDHS